MEPFLILLILFISFFGFLNYFKISYVFVPKNSIALFYSKLTGEIIKLSQGSNFRSFFKLYYTPWYNKFQEKRTHIVDIRSYADPIINYEILTESQLKLTITGKAIVKMKDPIKAYASTNDLDATIDSLCKAELRNHFSKLTAKEIIQTQDLVEQKLTAALNNDLKDYGTLVEKFIISHINLPTALTKAVELSTAQQAEHKCKLLEVQNHKRLEEERIAIQNSKHEAEIIRKEKQLQLENKKKESENRNKVNFYDELKERGVNLTEYLKYEELKKTKATIIAGLEHATVHHHTPNNRENISQESQTQ